jgi:hypothetical protein
MRMDVSDEHPENASVSIDESREPDANVIRERDSHPWKHSLSSWLTDEGTQIDRSDLQH